MKNKLKQTSVALTFFVLLCINPLYKIVGSAFEFVSECLDSGDPITEGMIRELHGDRTHHPLA